MKISNPFYWKSLGYAFVILLSAINCTMAQEHVDEIDDLLNTYVDYGQFNGTALVSKNGEVIYKKAFGVANMDWGIKNELDTKFRLASVTKQFTAMLVMQLVADGSLDLTTPITTYLTDYPKENGDKITIHHLMSHTSGIPNYTSFNGYQDLMKQRKSPSELIELFADSTLVYQPGERFDYSNSGYVLLGAIIEKTTGKTFAEMLEEKIFKPLNMNNSGYEDPNKILENKASGYYKNGPSYTNAHFIDMSVAFTAGGIYSTIEDMHLWDQALYTEKLLPKKYLDMMFTEHIPAWRNHYGYGWNISTKRLGNTNETIKTIDHDGYVNGFSSIIMRVPNDKITILLLNNTGGAPLYRMAESVIAIMKEKTYDAPKQSVANAVYDMITTKGLKEGLVLFQEIKNDPNYNLDERELNLIGYEFLNNNKMDEGLAIFKLNIEENPRSGNAYDSYGEALLKIGNQDEAIANYKMAISLDANNHNAIKLLQALGVDTDAIKIVNYNLFDAGEQWGNEIFHFPLHFAPTIEYTGWEDAQFPRGWSKIDSDDFWSYTFAWKIDKSGPISQDELVTNLQKYFDGIMASVNKDIGKVLPKTIATLHEKDSSEGPKQYTGSMSLYDSFITKDTFTLNVEANVHHCEGKERSILEFRFSPKGFGHAIWDKLHQVVLRDEVCE